MVDSAVEALRRHADVLSPNMSGESSRRRERTFFSGIAIAVALTVFVGFAPTFYLHSAAGGRNVLTPSLMVHGVAFSAWIVLLVAQTSLVAARRVELHRALGFAGAIFGIVMLAAGAYVAIDRARSGLFVPAGNGSIHAFLTIPMATLVVFPVLLGAAVYLRRRAAAHKRLMLIATFEMMTAAVARWPVISAYGLPAAFGVTDLFVVAIAIYDFATFKRLHPATLWGGLFLIASQPLRVVIGGTSTWLAFANWLIG